MIGAIQRTSASHDMEQRGLAAATRHAVSLGGVLAVFDDVQVERAHLDGAEAHQALHHLMEVVGFVGFQDIFLNAACAQPTAQRSSTTISSGLTMSFTGSKPLRFASRKRAVLRDTTIAVGGAFEDLSQRPPFRRCSRWKPPTGAGYRRRACSSRPAGQRCCR